MIIIIMNVSSPSVPRPSYPRWDGAYIFPRLVQPLEQSQISFSLDQSPQTLINFDDEFPERVRPCRDPGYSPG